MRTRTSRAAAGKPRPLAAAVLAAMVSALAGCGGSGAAAKPSAGATPAAAASSDDRASLPLFPDLEAPLLEGGRVRIADLRGKVVVLDVMASWCQTCVELLPRWQALADRHADAPMHLLLVSQDEDPEDMRTLLRNRGVHHPVALDGTERWWNALGLVAVPTAIVIGADGRHVATLRGLGQGGFAKLEAIVAAELDRARAAPSLPSRL